MKTTQVRQFVGQYLFSSKSSKFTPSQSVAPERIEKWAGHMYVRREAPEKICRVSPLFWLYIHTSIISRFGERFHGGHIQFGRFLFAVHLLTVPLDPCPATYKSGTRASIKVGGTGLPCPVESAPVFHRAHSFVV